MKEGYIPQADRKKILLLCDDIRFTSGISTMAKEIVIGTAHHFNWVNLGAAIQHPDQGKRFDICQDTNLLAGISDASVFIVPISGYGTPELLRQVIDSGNVPIVRTITNGIPHWIIVKRYNFVHNDVFEILCPSRGEIKYDEAELDKVWKPRDYQFFEVLIPKK